MSVHYERDRAKYFVRWRAEGRQRARRVATEAEGEVLGVCDASAIEMQAAQIPWLIDELDERRGPLEEALQRAWSSRKSIDECGHSNTSSASCGACGISCRRQRRTADLRGSRRRGT